MANSFIQCALEADKLKTQSVQSISGHPVSTDSPTWRSKAVLAVLLILIPNLTSSIFSFSCTSIWYFWKMAARFHLSSIKKMLPASLITALSSLTYISKWFYISDLVFHYLLILLILVLLLNLLNSILLTCDAPCFIYYWSLLTILCQESACMCLSLAQEAPFSETVWSFPGMRTCQNIGQVMSTSLCNLYSGACTFTNHLLCFSQFLG